MRLNHARIVWGTMWVLVGAILPAQAELSAGQQVLQGAAQHAQETKIFSLEASFEVDMLVDGKKDQFATQYRIAHQRPDKVAVYSNDGRMEFLTFTDAQTTTRYIPSLNQYQVENSPTPSLEVIQSLANPMFDSVLSFLAEYTAESPFSSLLVEGVDVKRVGEETINGVVCDRLSFSYMGLTMEAWFSQGATPLLQRVEPEMPDLVKAIQKNAATENVTASVQLDTQQWALSGDIQSLLTFSPGEEDEKVEDFYQPQPPQQSASNPMLLKGKEAPAIKLSMLDGTAFDLASKKGQEIVVLDFWATWCGPCRQGMPILSKVVKEFEAKGVRLYAVNLREEPDAIQAFLDSTGLDLTVLMDTNGAAANAYQVSSIPQMVIVGRDGLVKEVHVGIGRSYEQDVRAELTELTN